ncbi:MAG: hypothetical protein QOH04_1130 [Sphingomonadales bacterium]|jgi:hypothetical protein|nr:hypothetical protein [Sphingomonadales bacterium]MEA3035368.1 hypothetical protein [Sphingomonadales bacterium]
MKPDIVMDEFARHMGESFEVVVGEIVFPITLAEARPIQPSIRKGGSFSLIFNGPHSPILNQAMYDVRCGGEEWSLFIVPVGEKNGVFEYEVIFN